MLNLPKPTLGSVAQNPGESAFPDLWRGLIMACDAGINDRTDRWTDWSGKGNHWATLNNVTFNQDELRGLRTTGGNSGAKTGIVNIGRSELTVVIDFKSYETNSIKYPVLEASPQYNGSGNSNSFIVYLGGTDKLEWARCNNSTSALNVRNSMLHNRRIRSLVGISFSANTNSDSYDALCYINGLFIPSSIVDAYNDQNYSTFGAYNWYLSQRNLTDTGYSVNAIYYKLFAWNRVLTPQEHQLLALGASPLQKRRLWTFASRDAVGSPISMSIRASSSASCLSGLSRGGLVTARANSVAGVLGAPLTGHSLNAKASSESTAQAQPKRTASLTGKADSASTARAQAVKSTKLAGQVESESSETANITKSVPLASITGRTATASSQSLGVIGGHRVGGMVDSASLAYAGLTVGIRLYLSASSISSAACSIALGNVVIVIPVKASAFLMEDDAKAFLTTPEAKAFLSLLKTEAYLTIQTMKTGDTYTSFTTRLSLDGVPFDLTGWAVTFILTPDGGEPIRKAATVLGDATAGVVTCNLTSTEMSISGKVDMQWRAKKGTYVLTFPNTGVVSRNIEAAMAEPL